MQPMVKGLLVLRNIQQNVNSLKTKQNKNSVDAKGQTCPDCGAVGPQVLMAFLGSLGPQPVFREA